ncbi:hypothetical protein NL676_006441 [Syzygium grande]|nr:hypothetical protein NL676_006441 [Syzygium grande]
MASETSPAMGKAGPHRRQARRGSTSSTDNAVKPRPRLAMGETSGEPHGCLASSTSPMAGLLGYSRARFASDRYSSIKVLSALFSLEEGEQELNSRNDLRDNWGLFKNLLASFLSSRGGFNMNRFGGTFFFGEVVRLRFASSLRSL